MTEKEMTEKERIKKVKTEMSNWNDAQRKYMDEHDGKGFITTTFEEWESNATSEEKQRFCDNSNGIAKIQRMIHENNDNRE